MYKDEELKDSIGSRIKEKRLQYNLTQGELAEKLGVGTTTVSAWEKGRAAPRMGKVAEIAEFFKLPTSYFVSDNKYTAHGQGPPLPPEAITNIGVAKHKIPVYGSISAGVPLEAIENLTDTEIGDRLVNKYGKDKLFGLIVRGDSMNKIIPDGFYAILAKTDRVESGEVAAVICNGNDATLKRVAILEDGIVLQPSSTNPEYKSQMFINEAAEDVRVIGKLVAVMSPPDFKF
ncbi:putative Repressor LexA [Exiguobacterium sp. 8H]|uniref:LexA family protein n=1 Tax=unclassified Exiguobacterium TaxID=2644629 RepID=UPI0012F19E6B|nr:MULTISPECIES: XRE family transcriptional regulator [unclassified Exiguobacterium]VXB53096.1 conserved hypothetical protein [Exiguobacterium sp. 8A]VXB53691.1 putative Repressor LexA [Exiguobacterium sp. 8H]